MDWFGKNLLVLGATHLLVEAVQLAKSNGAHVTVIDYLENSPAKKYADEAYLISVNDIPSILNLVKEKNIDGIFTSFTDSILGFYVDAAKQADMPCFLTEEHVRFTNDKSFFKETCKKFNVPVIPEFFEYNNLKFPALVKPVDSSGSRGISVCNNYLEFETAKEKALSYSKKKKIIVEKFMDCEEITISYTFQDGEILLTSIHDRFFNEEQTGVTKVPNCYIYPSKYLERYIKEVNDNVINMLKSLKMQNGKIFLQSFADEKGFYIYEAGVRLNGCKIYNVIDKMCNYNELERMINYSLTGSMGNPHLRDCANPRFKKYAATLSYLLKPGIIGQIIGQDIVDSMKETIHSTLWHNEGDTIGEALKGTLAQTILRVSVSADNLDELIGAIEKINTEFKVTDKNGDNMLLTPYNPENLRLIYTKDTPYAENKKILI